MWIKDCLRLLQEPQEQLTAQSTQTVRKLLGPIRLELVMPDIGRPFYHAVAPCGENWRLRGAGGHQAWRAMTPLNRTAGLAPRLERFVGEIPA
jgi:hypothetical protein